MDTPTGASGWTRKSWLTVGIALLAIIASLVAIHFAQLSQHEYAGVNRSTYLQPVEQSANSAMILRIDSIKLNHALKPQGLRDGEINPDSQEVIWYTGNSRVPPGSEGVSVVAGHVAHGDSPDVFANLSEVKIGDVITTVNRSGARTVYTVSRAYTVTKGELRRDPAVWGNLKHGKRLVLVTCDDALGRRADGHRIANYVVVANTS